VSTEYHKIQSIYKRDPGNMYKTFLEGEYSVPEFEFLKNNEWVATEKVDGTNIRVHWNGNTVSFRGRTDRAQIPPHLLAEIENIFTRDNLVASLGYKDDGFESDVPEFVLYGEGYGPRIQKGGGKYRDTPSFVLFDVAVDGMYIERSNVEDIASKLGIDVVPIICHGTLDELVEFVRPGFKSRWGDFEAEGIVARPRVEMMTRRGRRIITKIKCKDFQGE